MNFTEVVENGVLLLNLDGVLLELFDYVENSFSKVREHPQIE